VGDDDEFIALMNSAGSSKLVVVDYNATWCGPCLKIAPVFIQLAHKFPQALFLGVDVDKCRETAVQQGVTAMPTFILYRNRVRVDTVKGAHPQELEEKIRRHYGESGESSDSSGPGGTTDVFPFVEQKSCECLNESDGTPFRAFLEGKSKLESDCDEQLILVYGFNQNLKLQAFKIKAPSDSGPKTLKIFINQPKTLDFDGAASMTPTQEITLTPEDLTGEKPVELRYVKFQNVSNLQIFIVDNQEGTDTTKIDSMVIYGLPLNTTNMSDFKRVAGTKGESH